MTPHLLSIVMQTSIFKQPLRDVLAVTMWILKSPGALAHPSIESSQPTVCPPDGRKRVVAEHDRSHAHLQSWLPCEDGTRIAAFRTHALAASSQIDRRAIGPLYRWLSIRVDANNTFLWWMYSIVQPL